MELSYINDIPMISQSMTLVTKNSPIEFNIIQFKPIEEDSNISIIFYDKIAEKFIKIIKDHLIIYKNNGDIYKTINIQSDYIDYIDSIAFEKNGDYLNILMSIEKEKMIMCYETIEGTHIGIIKDNKIINVIGMFFIRNNSHDTTYDFCIVFVNKLLFYSISKSNQIIDQEPILIIEMTYQTITTFAYDYDHSVLCCEMNNSTYDFYDLSKKNSYDVKHTMCLPYNYLSITTSSISSLIINPFSSYIYGVEKKDNTPNDQIHISKSQWFLETLYGLLYFIYLSYEDNQIQIYSIADYTAFELNYTINYNISKQVSTLQFIDNLIIAHNFSSNEMLVFDIKSDDDNKSFFDSIAFKYPYNSDVICHGEIFLKRNCNTLDSIYHVSINLKNYYAGYHAHDKGLALLRIINRSNSLKLCHDYYYDLIVNYYYKEKKLHMIQSRLINMLITFDQSNEDDDISLRKKKTIFNQRDVIIILFNFHENFKENNVIEQMCIRMILFYLEITNNNLEIDDSFHSILVNYLRKVSIRKLVEFLNNNYLPSSIPLMKYLSNLKDKNAIIQQSILDMLIEEECHEEIFIYLYQNNQIAEAIVYWNSIIFEPPPCLSKSMKSMIKSSLKTISSIDKRVIWQFINS